MVLLPTELCPPPKKNSYHIPLTLNVVIFGDGTIGQRPCFLFAMWGHSKIAAFFEPRRESAPETESVSTLTLNRHQRCENLMCVVWTIQSMVFCYRSLSRLIQVFRKYVQNTEGIQKMCDCREVEKTSPKRWHLADPFWSLLSLK